MKNVPSSHFRSWCPNFACCSSEVWYELYETRGGNAYYRAQCPDCGYRLSMSASAGPQVTIRKAKRDQT